MFDPMEAGAARDEAKAHAGILLRFPVDARRDVCAMRISDAVAGVLPLELQLEYSLGARHLWTEEHGCMEARIDLKL